MGSHQDRRVGVRVSCLIVIVIAGIAVAACGGESRPAPAGSASNPLVAAPSEPVAGRSNESQPRHHGSAGTSKGAGTADAQPGYQKLLEHQTARPQSRFSPCNLVTPNRARAILGEPVAAPVEAPQGPTCIYRSRSGDDFTTIAVQAVPFSQLRRQIPKPQRLHVAGRTGYCSGRGQSIVYVPLPERRVLSVGAPCGVAKQFALTALQRLVP